jgi:hypothetical protein
VTNPASHPFHLDCRHLYPRRVDAATQQPTPMLLLLLLLLLLQQQHQKDSW